MEFQHRFLPYYMTYQGPFGMPREDTVIRDMEYLQQMYPAQIRRYQQRIAQLLDRMDYEGSMIYDEYPDRYSLERLAKSILEVLKREEQEGTNPEQDSPEKWEWLLKLVQVLLSDEVYKRRHGGRRGIVTL